MPLTPASAADPYLTAERFGLYRDVRTVLEFLTDDDSTPSLADALSPDTTAGKNLLAALGAASGQVDLSCLVGKRYQPADLAALTGNGLSILESLVADLAFWHLARRRWPRLRPEDVSGVVPALDTLKDLKAGELIFGLVEAAAAGLPAVSTPDPRQQLGPAKAVAEAQRLYGSAADQSNYTRGGY